MEYKEKLTKKNANDEVQGSAYQIGKPENNETITKMIFDDTTEEKNYVKAYWLASPGVTIDAGGARFGLGTVHKGVAISGELSLLFSHSHWCTYEYAVRPIVSLRHEITLEDIKIISGTEKEWTGEGPKMSSFECGNIKEGRIE